MTNSSESALSYLSATLRANEGLLVAVALCIGFPLVLTLVALIMRSQGASLRPVWFMIGLVAPLLVTFLIAGLVRARKPMPRTEPGAGLTMRDAQFADRDQLFSPEILRDLIREAKSGLPGILDSAAHAEAGVTPTGETALVAQFPTDEDAKKAAAAYHRGFQLSNVSGDEEKGWRAKRGLQGDFIEMLRTGRFLFVWSGPTKEAAARLRSGTNLAKLTPIKAATSGAAAPLVPSLQPLAKLMEPPLHKAVGVGCLLLLYVVTFFKGAAWAGSAPAVPGVPKLSANELASRLEAVNSLDVPFTVERGKEPNEFFANWRFADAKWLDTARAHGLRRSFRIKMRLDEESGVVRATDYTSDLDWSAGKSGAQMQWKASVGIVFFQFEKHRVFGLQLDEQGRPKPELSYTYKFNLSEMKSPLIQTVTHAGWTWQPTLLQGPKWLRWLTE